MVEETKLDKELDKLKTGVIGIDNMRMVVDNLLLQSDMDQVETNLKNSIQICFNKMKKEQKIIKSVREAMRGEPIKLMNENF